MYVYTYKYIVRTKSEKERKKERKKERPVPIVNSEFSAILCDQSCVTHSFMQRNNRNSSLTTALSWALYQKDPYNM